MEEPVFDVAAKDVIVHTSLGLVPFVGNGLSIAYASTKQEKRFRRIESFYEEVSISIAEMKELIRPLEEHNKEILISLIERLNEQIEIESSEQKREYLKNYFTSLLKNPTLESNYDERLIFLDCLSSITVLEFHILISYSKVQVTPSFPAIEGGILLAARSRLENMGLLTATYRTETRLGESPTKKNLSISEFGKKFIRFCTD